MSGPDDDAVGYCRPPKHTRWKKGQCGNPNKQRQPKIPNIADMIEDELAKLVSIKEKGRTRRITVLEVILLRLLPEIARANRRAIRIQRKYQAYAQNHPTVVYEPTIDSEEMAGRFEAELLHGIYGPPTKYDDEFATAWYKMTVIEMDEVYRETLRRAGQWD